MPQWISSDDPKAKAMAEEILSRQPSGKVPKRNPQPVQGCVFDTLEFKQDQEEYYRIYKRRNRKLTSE